MLGPREFMILFTSLHFSTVNIDQLLPCDVGIDHYKIDTTRDLTINTCTGRPRFSWKVSISDSVLVRNAQPTTDQVQLQSIATFQFEWDSGWVCIYTVDPRTIHRLCSYVTSTNTSMSTANFDNSIPIAECMS